MWLSGVKSEELGGVKNLRKSVMAAQLFNPAQFIKSGFHVGRGDAPRSAWLARADLEYLFHQPLGVVAVDISHVIYPCLLT